jgi:hypothetical protein
LQYVLIDHENVQPADLAGLNADKVCVLVFTGAHQKVAISLIEAVQTLGERGRFIRISGSGKNALDFHIAYYLGKLSERDPQASYVLVTADSGYDPLIAHLNAQGIATKRIAALKQTAKTGNSPVAEPTPAKKVVAKKSLVITVEPEKATPAKKVAATVGPSAVEATSDADKVIRMLAGMPNNLPRNEASLRRMVGTWLSSKDTNRLDAVVAELKRRTAILMSGNKLAYKLPKA